MRILKTILIVIVIIIAIPLIIALFVKNEYAVQREITINKPKAEVFDYVKHIKNQADYNTWAMADPNIKNEYRGTDGTVGFVSHWSGNNDVGEGEQEITKITEDERVDLKLHFIRPFEGDGVAFMTTEEAGVNATKVTWGMQGKSAYPMNFMNLFMDSAVGNPLGDGLKNMKANLEKQ